MFGYPSKMQFQRRLHSKSTHNCAISIVT